jgi:bisphosphoglycerate-dependent phosphoglycerate mutase
MKSKIVLIRHGITEGNVRHLYYGSTNVPLAQKGIDQLKAQQAQQQKFLRQLATEYVILGKECESEGMLPAAQANYQKALQLCPEHTEAKRRLKKLKR